MLVFHNNLTEYIPRDRIHVYNWLPASFGHVSIAFIINITAATTALQQKS